MNELNVDLLNARSSTVYDRSLIVPFAWTRYFRNQFCPKLDLD